MSLHVRASVRPSVRPHMRPSVHMSVRPHVQVHASQSIHVHVRFSRTLGNIFRIFYGHDDLTQCRYPSVRPSVRPSVHKSVGPQVHASQTIHVHVLYVRFFRTLGNIFQNFLRSWRLNTMSLHVRPSVRPSVRPAAHATTSTCLLLRGWPTRGTSSCLNIAIASSHLAVVGTSSHPNIPELALGCEASNPSAPPVSHPR